MSRGADIKVAAAAGLSVYLPLYWLATRPDSDGAPNPLTAAEVGVLLLTLAAYLLVPFVMSLLSRRTLAARAPSWLFVSVVGSAILVLSGVVAVVAMRQTVTAGGAVMSWLVLSLWTMPASAGVYYFGAAARLMEAWSRGPDYAPLDLRK